MVPARITLTWMIYRSKIYHLRVLTCHYKFWYLSLLNLQIHTPHWFEVLILIVHIVFCSSTCLPVLKVSPLLLNTALMSTPAPPLHSFLPSPSQPSLCWGGRGLQWVPQSPLHWAPRLRVRHFGPGDRRVAQRYLHGAGDAYGDLLPPPNRLNL